MHKHNKLLATSRRILIFIVSMFIFCVQTNSNAQSQSWFSPEEIQRINKGIVERQKEKAREEALVRRQWEKEAPIREQRRLENEKLQQENQTRQRDLDDRRRAAIAKAKLMQSSLDARSSVSNNSNPPIKSSVASDAVDQAYSLCGLIGRYAISCEVDVSLFKGNSIKASFAIAMGQGRLTCALVQNIVNQQHFTALKTNGWQLHVLNPQSVSPIATCAL